MKESGTNKSFVSLTVPALLKCPFENQLLHSKISISEEKWWAVSLDISIIFHVLCHLQLFDDSTSFMVLIVDWSAPEKASSTQVPCYYNEKAWCRACKESKLCDNFPLKIVYKHFGADVKLALQRWYDNNTGHIRSSHSNISPDTQWQQSPAHSKLNIFNTTNSCPIILNPNQLCSSTLLWY